MTEPGWYTDDQDPSLARWHDGTRWTGHTLRKADWQGPGEPPPPTTTQPPPAAPAPPSAPSGWVPPTRDPEPPRPPEHLRPPERTRQPEGPVLPEPVQSVPPASPPTRPTQPRPTPPTPATPRERPVPPKAKAKAREQARTQTRRRPRGPALRRPALVVTLAAIVLALLVLQVGPLGGDDGGDGGGSDSEDASGPQSYGAEWSTLDGSSYRLSVVTSAEPVDDESPGGCFEKPAAGHANYGFTIKIDNLSDEAAPFPDITFAVNATPEGTLDTSPESLAGVNRQVEITPKAKGASCEDASAIRPTGRSEIEAGESATLHGVVGGVVTPVPDGLALIIRYIQIDPTHPRESSTADILAPFPEPPS